MPSNFVTLPEIRRAARKRLSRDVWNFGAGGSETETTIRRNRAALDRLAIRQDILVDVREIDLSTTFLGLPLSMPVAVAPMGGLVLFHPQGDVEMARGAGLGDTLVVLSGATGWPVEDVAAAGTGPKLFQLYHHGDRAWVADLLARVEASGYRSVCLTVDVQLYSRRERDIVNRYSPRQAMSIAPNPRGPDPNYPARLTWDDVEWLRKTTRLPVGLKGIMTARDARRAVESGVDAVDGRAEIVIDGGFRRGTDIIKAVALGANVVALGRTILWGLAADGAAGVACALEILKSEIRTTLGLCGQTSIRGLRPDLILRVDH